MIQCSHNIHMRRLRRLLWSWEFVLMMKMNDVGEEWFFSVFSIRPYIYLQPIQCLYPTAQPTIYILVLLIWHKAVAMRILHSRTSSINYDRFPRFTLNDPQMQTQRTIFRPLPSGLCQKWPVKNKKELLIQQIMHGMWVIVYVLSHYSQRRMLMMFSLFQFSATIASS